MLRASSPDARVRVLLADDEPVVRQVLALVMTQHGLHVEEATDGLDALARLRSFSPHIVVSDLNMPRCSGDELCRRLKAEPSTRHIPVLIVTGSMFKERDLLASGCVRVMTKPVSATGLIEAVLDIVEHSVIGLPAWDEGRWRLAR